MNLFFHIMNRCSIVFAFTVLLAGCQSINPDYAGPSTKSFSQVEVSAIGLKRHSAYPNDVVWLHVLDGTTSAMIGTVKITHDKPDTNLAIDQDKPLILRFSSIEAHFGGYSSCGGDIPLNAMSGERFSIVYATQKWSCSVEAKRATGTGDFVTVANVEGRVSGTQFQASVVR